MAPGHNFLNFGPCVPYLKNLRPKTAYFKFTTKTGIILSWPCKIYSMALKCLKAPYLICTIHQFYPHINCFNKCERYFNLFLYYNILGLTTFSLLPWQVYRHIYLVVDFINLGLTKLLRPQDAVRALYVGLTITEMSQRLKFHQNWSVIKTEISPKIKSHQI